MGKTPAELKAEIDAAHAALNKQILDAYEALIATGGKPCVKLLKTQAPEQEQVA